MFKLLFFLLLPSLYLDTSLVALKSSKVYAVPWKINGGKARDIPNLNVIYMHKHQKKPQVNSFVLKY